MAKTLTRWLGLVDLIMLPIMTYECKRILLYLTIFTVGERSISCSRGLYGILEKLGSEVGDTDFSSLYFPSGEQWLSGRGFDTGFRIGASNHTVIHDVYSSKTLYSSLYMFSYQEAVAQSRIGIRVDKRQNNKCSPGTVTGGN